MRLLLILALLLFGYKAVMSSVPTKYTGWTITTWREYVQNIKAVESFLSDVPTSLVLAIMKTESNFNPEARGGAGEYGLMQVLPTTWTWINNKYGLGFYDPMDVYQNVVAGMYVLKDYFNQVGNWMDVIHAYNVGPAGFKQGRRANEYFTKVLANWALV